MSKEEADTPQVSHNDGGDGLEEEEEVEEEMEMEMRHHYNNNDKNKMKKKKKKKHHLHHHRKSRRGKALGKAKEVVLSLFRNPFSCCSGGPISLGANNKPPAATTGDLGTTKPKAKTSRASSFLGHCCRLCFCSNRPPPAAAAATADDDDPSSDPNSPSFTYEMLRSLIENNHFYSNPHLAALQSS